MAEEDAGVLGDRVRGQQLLLARLLICSQTSPSPLFYFFQFSTRPVSQLFSESLLVEVDCVSEARLHLWYLVTDDLHQHLGELHLQGLGLTKGVEAEVQQVPHQLDNTETQCDEKHIVVLPFYCRVLSLQDIIYVSS